MRRGALLVASLLLVPALARAEPTPAAVEQGRAYFQRGVTLFRAGDYRNALAAFNHANAVAPSFRIQFNIGQTCAELADHACATKAFEQFLDEGGKQVAAAQRATAERELKRLHALVGKVRVLVNEDGATVAIDETTVGTSPIAEPVLVVAGKRKVTARAGTLLPVSAVVDVPAGETVTVPLSLTGANGSVAPIGRPADRGPFWIGVAATGVLTVATITFGALTLGAKSDLDDAVGRRGVTAGEVEAAQSKIDHRAIVTDVFAGAALVAAGITTWLFFETRGASTHVGVGPGAVCLSHVF